LLRLGLKATSSMTNKIAPSAERETRFTLTWFTGKEFIGWSQVW
jgi:hypothetical protein